MADFRTELVAAALAEQARAARRKETDPAMTPLLRDYWMVGAGRSSTAADGEIRKRTAWSAAFISFVVRHALERSGSPAKFDFSASHSVYAGGAIRNQLNGTPAPVFVGLPPDGEGAVAPAVGDIIGVTRVAHIDDYADAMRAARMGETYFSHFDVVVGNDGRAVTTIGGNVADTVGGKTFTLRDGLLPLLPFKFNSAGTVISGPFICVIKHRE